MTESEVGQLARFFGREIEKRVRQRGWGPELQEVLAASRLFEGSLGGMLRDSYKLTLSRTVDPGMRDLLNLPLTHDPEERLDRWTEGLGDA